MNIAPDRLVCVSEAPAFESERLEQGATRAEVVCDGHASACEKEVGDRSNGEIPFGIDENEGVVRLQIADVYSLRCVQPSAQSRCDFDELRHSVPLRRSRMKVVLRCGWHGGDEHAQACRPTPNGGQLRASGAA